MTVAATSSSLDGLVQYGAVGILAVAGLIGVRVLFQREVKAHDAAEARADRMEAELAKLNNAIQERYLTTLAEATRAISAALEAQQKGRQ